MTRRVFLSLALLVAAASDSLAAETMAFEIYADKSGEFRWRLKDAEGMIVATSGQGYKAKADCTKMVDNFKSDISKYEFEFYEDNKKENRFRLKAKNGSVVGSSSSGYKMKADAEKIVDAIKKGAKDASVTDETKKK